MNQTGQDPGNNVCSLEPIDLPKPASIGSCNGYLERDGSLLCLVCRTPPALLQSFRNRNIRSNASMARHSQHRFQWSDFNVEVWLVNLQLLNGADICHLIGRIVSESKRHSFVQLKCVQGKEKP